MNIAAAAGNLYLDAPRPGSSSAPASKVTIGHDPVSGIVGRFGCARHGSHASPTAGASIAGSLA